MNIGLPTEVKADEHRVALTPPGVRELTERGHAVFVQQGAGRGSQIDDFQYEEEGATLAASADEVFSRADLIVKVKEPQPNEVERLRPGQLLFTYLHLAADTELTRSLLASKAACLAYEDGCRFRREAPAARPDE